MAEIIHNQEEQKFSTEIEGKEAALKYSLEDNTINFYSTFTPPEARGTGLARKLVEAGMAYAEIEDLAVEATCSYVIAYLQKENLKKA